MANMNLLNQNYKKKIEESGARFVFEIEYSPEDFDIIKSSFIQACKSYRDFNSQIRYWVNANPTLLLQLLTGIARETFNQDFNGFWKNFWAVVGLSEQSTNVQSIIGTAFINELRRRSLEYNIDGYRFVGPILVHTGLPEVDYPDFIDYLRKLESTVELEAYSDITREDFFMLVKLRHDLSVSPRLSRMLSDINGQVILWQMATLVGECAALTGTDCPDEWKGSIRERLYKAITSTNSHKRGSKSRKLNFGQIPIICWKFDLQKVVAILPAQTLSATMRCELGGIFEGVYPFERIIGDQLEIEEAVSEAIGWEDTIDLEVNYSRGKEIIRNFSLSITLNKDYTLFDTRGYYISPDHNLPLGKYLLLTNKVIIDSPFLKITDYLQEPVGWYSHHGYEVEVSCKASLGDYSFAPTKEALSWEIADKPKNQVMFDSLNDIWINNWPKIIIRTTLSTISDNAYVEFKLCDSSKRIFDSRLIKIRELCTQFKQNEVQLDLSLISNNLKGFNGLITMKLVSFKSKIPPCLELQFIHLEEIDFAYSKATRQAGLNNYSLRINSYCHEVEPRFDDLVSRVNKQIWELTPLNQIQLPNVRFKLILSNGLKVDLSCRIPITRVRHISSESFGVWSKPPLPVNLSTVGTEDILRVELESPVELLNKELAFRITHGELLTMGKPSLQKNVFEVSLYRWRSVFGISRGGVVEVFHNGKWLELIALQGQSEASPTIREEAAPTSEENIDPVSYGIVQSILNNKKDDLTKYIDQAFEICAKPDTHMAYSDHYHRLIARGLLVLSRYDDLIEFIKSLNLPEDIPELHLYYYQAKLRSGNTADWELNELDNRIKAWPECPEQKLLLAEINYRIARMGLSSNSALQATRRYLWNLNYPDSAFLVDAIILDSLVAFLLNDSVLEHNEKIIKPRQQVKLAHEFLTLLECVQKYLRLPFPSWSNQMCDSHLTSDILDKLPYDLVLSQDKDYISLCINQSSGHVAKAREYFDLLSEYSDQHFYGIELLKARQYRLEGNHQLANEFYKPLLKKYPNVLDEFI